MASRLEQAQQLRQRGGKGPRADPGGSFLKLEKDVDATDLSCSNDKKAQAPPAAPSWGHQHPNEECGSYAVAKWAILRLLAVVYFFAFLGAHYQNEGLMGRHGLEPAALDAAFSRYSTPTQGFLHHPTVFWFVPLTDTNLSRLYLGGVVLSCVVAAAGINSWLIQLVLWLAYFSIVTVAQQSPAAASFYSYLVWVGEPTPRDGIPRHLPVPAPKFFDKRRSYR
jgi:hypothetical protein